MKDWRGIVFGLAIAMLFVPMVFLGVNTAFQEIEENCTRLYKPCIDQEAECLEEAQRLQEEQLECYRDFEAMRKTQDGHKFIALIGVCLLISLLLLSRLHNSIIYGLFFGIVITAFVSTIAYLRARSFAGFILLVLLFIMAIYFIQKQSQEHHLQRKGRG
jgi:ABC-type glycerol-3-phosphate transport system permease component